MPSVRRLGVVVQLMMMTSVTDVSELNGFVIVVDRPRSHARSDGTAATCTAGSHAAVPYWSLG
jgi:hypothetical protein